MLEAGSSFAFARRGFWIILGKTDNLEDNEDEPGRCAPCLEV